MTDGVMTEWHRQTVHYLDQINAALYDSLYQPFAETNIDNDAAASASADGQGAGQGEADGGRATITSNPACATGTSTALTSTATSTSPAHACTGKRPSRHSTAAAHRPDTTIPRLTARPNASRQECQTQT